MQLFDQTLSGSESRARIKLRNALAERAKLSEDRLAPLGETLPVLADVGIPDEAVGTLRQDRHVPADHRQRRGPRDAAPRPWAPAAAGGLLHPHPPGDEAG
ncbi:hypothetical protein [Streptomyces antimycoticus]|uniref:hypothetical protein n=1 Tax=Streptomyces antimycoticus TaxID=68175 RepID=UPI001374FDA0|nr:hypothetical protein [Streptomyces antimycoticus]